MRRIEIRGSFQLSLFTKKIYAFCGHCDKPLSLLLHHLGALIDGELYIVADWNKAICSCEFANNNIPLTFSSIEAAENYAMAEYARIQSGKEERFLYVVDSIFN